MGGGRSGDCLVLGFRGQRGQEWVVRLQLRVGVPPFFRGHDS